LKHLFQAAKIKFNFSGSKNQMFKRYGLFSPATGFLLLASGSWQSVTDDRLLASSQQRVASGRDCEPLNLARRAVALAKAGER
jgi:hypothetical protein